MHATHARVALHRGRWSRAHVPVTVVPQMVPDAYLAVLERLQRELTTRYFLCDNGKVLVIVSDGVAPLSVGENRATALERADRAMYLVKHKRKNWVVGG